MLALLVTDLGFAAAEATVARARALARAHGPSLVFGVRDHAAPVRVRLDLARRLVANVRSHGARVVVHDRIDVALAAEADGVWLAERSVSARDARSLLAPRAFVGRSCHDAQGLSDASLEGVDAVTLSPVFASPGKGAPLGLETFAALRARQPTLAVLALGGVDASSGAALRAAGAAGFAAIRAWLDDDGIATVEALVAAFRG